MLRALRWPIECSPGYARLDGGHRFRAADIVVPADFSSAAFFIVAATLVPGSELRLLRVGINPRRTGLLHVLRAMGADIREENAGEQGGEPVCDRGAHARPHRSAAEHVADMIDEFPVLFVAAACAEGDAIVRGAAELRVKESDRIATMADGLRTLGVQVDETPDGATIHGGTTLGVGRIDSHGDHRIAMAFAVAAQLSSGELRIDDVANVATSFPGFDALARQAGFGLREIERALVARRRSDGDGGGLVARGAALGGELVAGELQRQPFLFQLGLLHQPVREAAHQVEVRAAALIAARP